jgi:hypothetical protein
MIIYSTSPGHVAEDGTARTASSASISPRKYRRGVEGSAERWTVFNQVNTATKGRQTPWYNSSLLGDFYFRPIDQKAEGRSARRRWQRSRLQ